MLFPLAIGLALKARYGELAARVKPVLDWISNISLILLICLITAANIDKVLQVFGTRAILAGSCLSSWVLGLVGCSADRVPTQNGSWRSVLDSGTLPPHSWWRVKVSATQKWSSWSSLLQSLD